VTDLNAVDRELRQAIAELSLISHASTQNFDPIARDTSDEPGGRRPSGGDLDRPGRNASNDEKQAWFESYHRKTPSHFRGRRQMVFDALGSGAEQREGALDAFEQATAHAVRALVLLRDDARACVDAWRRRPVNLGDAPQTMQDFGWKQYIALSAQDPGELSRQYGCTRRYINKIKAMDWAKDLRAATEADELARATREWRKAQGLPTLEELEAARHEARRLAREAA
jgi:hypothetical protein